MVAFPFFLPVPYPVFSCNLQLASNTRHRHIDWMDQAEQYELKGFVGTIYSAIRAGPYNDAAADAILSLYPSILHFWNRRFAHHCQLVKEMQSSPTQFLVQSKTASEQEKEKYRENQNRQLSHIAAINTECEAGMKP
jgi:hypothetical protein